MGHGEDTQLREVAVPSPQRPLWETTAGMSVADAGEPESMQTFSAIPPRGVLRDPQVPTSACFP